MKNPNPTYVIMPTEWDYENDHSNTIEYLRDHGAYVPSDITYLVELCGAFFQPLKKVRHFVEDLKAKWPFVKFALYEGDTWGELKLVKEY